MQGPPPLRSQSSLLRITTDRPPAHKERFNNVEFSDVSYSVKVRDMSSVLHPKEKTILRNVSGEFLERQVSAIVGAPGSGKTALLNFLSGYKTRGYKGNVFVKGRPRNLEEFVKKSSYSTHEDPALQDLKVFESMRLASRLKFISARINDFFIQTDIKRILVDLKLFDAQNVPIRKLSCGERTLLAIATQLLHKPKIMFFDEITTGLDSLATICVLSALKELAKSGKTVVCTVQQAFMPSLGRFDALYVLTPSGQCMYRGKSTELCSFLSSAGLQCPSTLKTIDYAIDLSVGKYGNHNETLVRRIGNGRSNIWSDQDDTGIHMQTENRTQYKPRKLLKSINQFKSLFERTLIVLSRDKYFLVSKILVPLLLGIFFGSVFYNIGQSGLYTYDNVIMLYCSIMTVVYLSAYSVIVKLPKELRLVQRDCFNQLYSLNSYFVCNICFDLLLQVMSTGLFCTVVYVMTKQPIELYSILLFFLMMITTGLTFQAAGTLAAILFANIFMCVIVISSFILPMTVFTGVLIRLNDTPIFISWIYDVSIMRHSLQGVLQAIYGNQRSSMPCHEDYCHNGTPEAIFRDLNMTENRYLINIVYIFVMYCVLKICKLFVLKNRFA